MKPVMQTKRGGEDVPPEERGDCLSAAIASILEVAIKDVPIPHSDHEEYHWWGSTTIPTLAGSKLSPTSVVLLDVTHVRPGAASRDNRLKKRRGVEKQ